MSKLSIPVAVNIGNGLELRALTPADASRLFLAVEANRAHLREWLPWVDKTQSSLDTRRFLESVEEGRKAGRTLAFAIEEHGKLRGVIGSHDIEAVNRNGHIGYWLAKDATGRGLATRATKGMLQILFERLQLERVEICCGVGNHPSGAVAERLGLRFEGIRRHGQWLNGRFIDLRVYSMLSEEWRASAENVEGGL